MYVTTPNHIHTHVSYTSLILSLPRIKYAHSPSFPSYAHRASFGSRRTGSQTASFNQSMNNEASELTNGKSRTFSIEDRGGEQTNEKRRTLSVQRLSTISNNDTRSRDNSVDKNDRLNVFPWDKKWTDWCPCRFHRLYSVSRPLIIISLSSIPDIQFWTASFMQFY